MQNRFRQVEQEYYNLRGRFAVGRITEEEFDTALRNMTFQDAQGRSWMIGANSGRWYYSDGGDWVQGDPATAASKALPEDIPAPEPVALRPEDEKPESVKGAVLPFLLIGAVLLGLAAALWVVVGGNNNLFAGVGGGATPTRIARVLAPATVPPTVTSTALPPTPTRVRTRATAAPGTTLVPETAPPSITPALVIEATDTRPALTSIPTITPAPFRPAPPNEGQPPPPDSPQAEVPEEIATAQAPAPVNAESNSGLPPDVYVTNLRVSPNPPRQRQEITFTASFLNTNPAGVGMEWRVILMDPNKQGRNKDYGESRPWGITVPPGRSEFSLVYIPVTSSGPCVNLQALVGRRLDDGGRVVFRNTSGGTFSTMLTFC